MAWSRARAEKGSAARNVAAPLLRALVRRGIELRAHVRLQNRLHDALHALGQRAIVAEEAMHTAFVYGKLVLSHRLISFISFGRVVIFW